LFSRQSLNESDYLILTQPEFAQAIASPKFKNIQIVKLLNYPDGTPGFYIIHLAYADNADEIFTQEKIARSQPEEGEVVIDNQMVKIKYSRLDMGGPENIFDGDIYTLMRGLEANPFIVELDFPEPRTISQVIADFANMDFTLTLKLYANAGQAPVVYEKTYRGEPGNPHVEIPVDQGPALVSKLRMEILSLNGGSQPHIHVRELKIVP
jgi:hypothetical protein